MDVHKATIAVAVAHSGRGEPEYYGEIPNDGKALRKVLRKINPDGEVLELCYEAGPCGYGLYRELQGLGHECTVVAPSLIPRKPGERMKTDRRDALALARLHRSGELTAVWVPGEDQEAVRDLTRCREDMKAAEKRIRQRLVAFLLRHGRVYSGKSRWTQGYWRWLEAQRFEYPVQQVVFQEYVESVKEARRHVRWLEDEMGRVCERWEWRAVVEGLTALRGISLVAAMTTMAELGDVTRFDSPRDLMGYLGLVPGEHSSGGQRRQTGITRTGNGHVRRVLVEAAWNYRFPARKSRCIEQRAKKAPVRVQALAWACQKRLCGRYRKLIWDGKNNKETTTAVARELAGFIWAIVCEVMGKPHHSRALA